MIIAIHQPHYLPWLGYLDRMRQADLFVILDHVQFERRNYQNRTKILSEGEARWLTVPVIQKSQLERVIDKRIDNLTSDEKHQWDHKHCQVIRHAYRDAPYLDLYLPRLQAILETRPEHLADLDQATLDFLRDAFDIRTPLIRSSELAVVGQRSDLILEICQAVGATVYLAGMGGSRNYLDRKAFSEAGIELAWQDFRHPVYTQCGGAPFVPGLSAIDLLLNHGPESRHIFATQAMASKQPAMA